MKYDEVTGAKQPNTIIEKTWKDYLFLTSVNFALLTASCDLHMFSLLFQPLRRLFETF